MTNALWLMVPALLLCAGAAVAEPCTLYKPDQVANARANVQRYAWAKALQTGYEKTVALLMEHDRVWLDAMLPELTPWPSYGQSCPVCVGKQSSMGETGLWNWSPSQPDELSCKYCKTVFPNPAYPETGVMEAKRMGQRFTFWLTDEERAHPNDRSGKGAFRWASWPVHTSWSGQLRFRKAAWVGSLPLPLAKLYALTGEPKYAERCLWVLDALAKRYPHWLYHSYNGVFADLPPGDVAAEMGAHPPAGQFPGGTIVTAFPTLAGANAEGKERLNNGFWGAGRLHSGADGEGEFLLNATVAYDLVREARGADGRPLLQAEERQRIEQDLLLAGCADLEHYADINNKCGPGRALSAAVACLFGGPDHARRALEGFQKLLGDDFHLDGFCRESPSYSDMHLGLMRSIPEILAGYSDPPGYHAPDGTRIDRFDPFAAVPRYRLALESMVRMLAPDRKFPVLGDTHAGATVSAVYVELLAAHYGRQYADLLEKVQGKPLAERGSEDALWRRAPDLKAGSAELPLRSEWFPGWQVGVLRGGGAESPTALFLNGYAAHGHRHADTLGLVYYDFGQELASDRGYIWDDPRNAWTSSTLAHNLVTVDGHNQDAKDRHSTLELFGSGPGVEVVQASANAYQACDTYRRLTALVRVSPQQTYALDVFTVRGGKLHQYGLNANGTLLGVTGTALSPATDEHKWLTHPRAGAAPAGVAATWDAGKAKLELRMLSAADRLVLWDAPGWRTYKGDQLHAPPIQQVLAERHGDPAESTFVALLTPYQGEASPVLSATLLPGLPAGVVGVKVELAGRTDYLVTSPDDGEHTVGPLTVAGRFAHVALDAGGKPLSAWLLAGTRLSGLGVELHLPEARATVPVTAVDGSTLTLAQPLTASPGDTVLASGTGWAVAKAEGNRLTVRDYPAEKVESVTVLRAAALAP